MPSDAAPLTWPEIADRLAPAPIIWLHSTSPGGDPHVVPVWAVVVARRLYLYSERASVKARNVRRDPRVAVHLESGADVVIVYGALVDVGTPGDSTAVVDAFAAKYDQPEERPFLPGSNPTFDVLYEFEARRALVWALPDSEASMRRWDNPDRP